MEKLRCGVFQVVDEILTGAAGVIRNVRRIGTGDRRDFAVKHWFARSQSAEPQVRMVCNGRIQLRKLRHHADRISAASQIFD